ncbi:MAG: hypothetical protein V8T24_11075 [Roseburia hominis]
MICKTGLPSLMRQGLSSVSTMMLNGQAVCTEMRRWRPCLS